MFPLKKWILLAPVSEQTYNFTESMIKRKP
jgi:hypothetical protein